VLQILGWETTLTRRDATNFARQANLQPPTFNLQPSKPSSPSHLPPNILELLFGLQRRKNHPAMAPSILGKRTRGSKGSSKSNRVKPLSYPQSTDSLNQLLYHAPNVKPAPRFSLMRMRILLYPRVHAMSLNMTTQWTLTSSLSASPCPAERDQYQRSVEDGFSWHRLASSTSKY